MRPWKRRVTWSSLTTPQRAGLVVAAAVQLGLAVAGWADLAKRDPREIRGSRTIWVNVCPARTLKFWTPGGSSTPLLTDEHLDVPLDYEGMAGVGSMLGTKALQIFDDTTCVVRAVRRWTQFYA